MISEEAMATGQVTCTSSYVPQPTTEPLQVSVEPRGAVKESSNTEAREIKSAPDTSIKTYQFTLPKNVLPNSPEKTIAQTKPSATNNVSMNVCTVVPAATDILHDTSTAAPASHNTTQIQPLLIPNLPSSLGSPNSVVTPRKVLYTTPQNLSIMKNVMSWDPGMPSGTQRCVVSSFNNVPNSNPRTSTIQNSPFTTLNDVVSWNPVGVLSGSQNSGAKTVKNVMLNGVVNLTCTGIAPSVKLDTPVSHNINVLTQNSSACLPRYTAKKILPKTVPRANVAKKFLVCPASLRTSSLAISSNGPGVSASKQPRFLLPKMNDVSNSEIPLGEIEIPPSLSGRNVTLKSQNGTHGSWSRPNNTEACTTVSCSKIIRKQPKIPPRHALPILTRVREVTMRRLQLDGSVRLEKRLVPFTLSEVPNDQSESGVAKKFVVCCANSVPVSSVPLPQKTGGSTASKTISTSVENVQIPRTGNSKVVPVELDTLLSSQGNIKTHPPSSLLLATGDGDIHPPSPTECDVSSNKSTFQWHHPYTGEHPSAAVEVVGVSGTANDPVCIPDDEDQIVLKTSSPPPPVNNEKCSGTSAHDSFSSYPEERSSENDLAVPWTVNDSIHSVEQSKPTDFLDPKSNISSLSKGPFQCHRPRSDAESQNSGKKSVLIEDSRSKAQIQAPPVKFKVKFGGKPHANMRGTGTPRTKTLTCPTKMMKKENEKEKENKKEKKKGKKRKFKEELILKTKTRKKEKAGVVKNSSVIAPPLTQAKVHSSVPGSPTSTCSTDGLQVSDKPDAMDSKTDITNCPSPSSRPSSPSGNVDPLSARPSSPCSVHEPKRENTDDIAELKYSPRLDGEELGIDNSQDSPRIEPGSTHSVTSSKCVSSFSPPSVANTKLPSCDTKDKIISNTVVDKTKAAENTAARTASPGLTCQQNKREDLILARTWVNSKRKLKAKVKGRNTAPASVPLKRKLVGRQDEQPKKILKLVHASNSTTPSSQLNGPKGDVFKPHTGSSRVIQPVSNVLRDCIVRKTIQDCYSEGVIPTIDKIHAACCDSGFEFPKTSVESHLISIGFNSVKHDSQMLLVEDHQFTTERIKYLGKLEKYQSKNFVYIFVSEYVKKNENGWQMSPDDVIRPSRDSAHVVLHAVSNECLLEGGLKVLKLGLFGLRRNDVISWLKCSVMPNIPEGSVVMFGHHSIFDKVEDSTESRPNIGYSKDEIITWLTFHKVTSINPDMPKAVLLTKVNKVILPKTSIFDKLARGNGFVPLHLPKHHRDLNPVEFIWRDIWEKLCKTPEIRKEHDFQDFVTQQFSSCSQTVSSIACNLVKTFECAYREFDFRFDELFEKFISVAGPETDFPQSDDAAPKKATLPGKLHPPTCPVCLRSRKLKGYRCSKCKDFWFKLRNDFKLGCSGPKLPVCDKEGHIDARPPKCKGCRRHRYELVLLHQAITLKKRPKYVLPIPPVTEMGKKHWSTKIKRRLRKSSNLTRSVPPGDVQETE